MRAQKGLKNGRVMHVGREVGIDREAVTWPFLPVVSPIRLLRRLLPWRVA